VIIDTLTHLHTIFVFLSVAVKYDLIFDVRIVIGHSLLMLNFSTFHYI